jgi:ribosomal protein S18 acetylase RimI-like enzyme
MQALIQAAKQKSIPMIRCETQNKNVPAIKFYLKQQFHFDGLEITFYRPDGLAKQDCAVFMKYIVPLSSETK